MNEWQQANVTEAAKRSYTGLPLVVTHVDDVPIYAFGRTFVHGVSPDFETNVVIQEGNTSQKTKVKPKHSWEVTENRIGSMVSWQPRVPQHDFQPFLAINLIDGDLDTRWCSRGEAQPDVSPAWIRIDLAAEEHLREIVLWPSKDGQGIPQALTIKVSCDAWHWTTVYEGQAVKPPPNHEPLR